VGIWLVFFGLRVLLTIGKAALFMCCAEGPGHAQPLCGGQPAAEGHGHALLQHTVGMILVFFGLRALYEHSDACAKYHTLVSPILLSVPASQ
jgi:hypothetical protein